MGYEVIARKWRPQQFDDVVGQAHVTETLKNAIQSNRLAHAYLFVGPRGIGKTSIARILAKALNCAKGSTVSPCGECDSCREIVSGVSLDVLEIDGASNNGVDQVRDLRDTVKYAPARGPFKIYIIDEVHMLSTAAFNALLKTLEEPPKHVKFIFATTEPDKILATIISRCQRFDLRRIPVPQIIERLELIAKDEKVKISPDALLAIARGAEGGLRDAESALDQLISFKGKTISEADVLSVFGLVARETLETLAAGVLSGDVAGVINCVAELDAAGKDLRRLVLELLAHFRNLLICMYVDDPGEGLDLTDAQVDVLRRQVGMTDSERVLRVVRILSEAEDKMRYALSRRVALEMALIRSARAATVVSIDDILRKIKALASGQAGAALAPPPTADLGKPAAPGPSKKSTGGKQGEPCARSPRPESAADFDRDLERLVLQWQEIVERVGRAAVGTTGALVDAQPIEVDARRVVLAFDPEFEEELQNVQNPRALKAMQVVLKDVLRRAVGVEFKLQALTHDRRKPEAAGPLAQKAGREESGKRNAPRTPHEWGQEPLVEQALDMFGGTIGDIRQ